MGFYVYDTIKLYIPLLSSGSISLNSFSFLSNSLFSFSTDCFSEYSSSSCDSKDFNYKRKDNKLNQIVLNE